MAASDCGELRASAESDWDLVCGILTWCGDRLTEISPVAVGASSLLCSGADRLTVSWCGDRLTEISTVAVGASDWLTVSWVRAG